MTTTHGFDLVLRPLRSTPGHAAARMRLAGALLALLLTAPAATAQVGGGLHASEAELGRRLDFEPPGCPPGSPAACGASCQGAEDPLPFAHIHTGESRVEAIDMKVKGRGLDFVWKRSYRSRARISSALGVGWDFSYNIFLRAAGPTVVVRNGDCREDVFQPKGPNSWECREFFQTLTRHPDGKFTMLFADNGRWLFGALDGSPAEGRIVASIDRNGNQLSFSYDGLGRLVTIVDTLGRNYTVAYGPTGLIASVTDFTNRTVLYERYQPGDAGGAPQDLKSARTPLVVGTSTGNDFPNGKKTVYTYSKGTGSPRLDHNLLTITDPRGNTILSNVYASTSNPKDPLFDRLVRQVWGDPGDIIDLQYAPEAPSPQNNFALRVTILNDRVGNVAEYYHDLLNRLVMVRRYTGRADPDSPTTKTVNRPTGKLRSSDPDYFETQLTYNVDSLIRRFVGPDGDETLNTYQLDVDPAAGPRERGNLIQRKLVPGPLGGSQAELVESFEYANGLGACCGSNFVSKHTNVDGEFETFAFDAAGNCTSHTGFIPTVVEDWEYNAFGQMTAHVHPPDGNGHRRRDEFGYYAAGPQKGYLATKTVDVGGLGLVMTCEYNPRGELVRSVDRRGFDTLITLNALDQPVVLRSRPVAPGGVRQRTEYRYDENDNVVQVDVENRDADGVLAPNAQLTTTYQYGTLDELSLETREVDVGSVVTTATEYDANRMPTLTRKGEATNGNDPANVIRRLYDERELPFRTTSGEGSPAASTVQYDYDGSARQVALHLGIEDPSHGSVLTSYDGYGRVLGVADPMGNIHAFDYDAGGNIVFESLYGELLDVPGSSGNVALVRRHREYDAMDRLVRSIEEHFDPVTQNQIGDGEVVTTYQWSDASTLLSTVDDVGQVRTFGHDTLLRRISVSDSLGNSSQYVLDGNGNLVAQVDTEVSDNGGPPVIVTSTVEYDALNRATARVSPAGNRTEYSYDSRDNLVRVVDPRGNVTRIEHDGMNRTLLTRRILTGTGMGGGPVVGAIETRMSWDDSSRLVEQQDGMGNVTSYAYDSLDRVVSQSNQDCTGLSYARDVHGRIVQVTDENGSVFGLSYDLSGRPVSRDVLSLAANVQPSSSFETHQYDGMGRLVRAQDDDSDVVRSWDSLSSLYLEIQNGLPVLIEQDVFGAEVSCTYPSGRTLLRDYDVVSRLDTIREGGSTIVDYGYVGPHRVETRTHVKPPTQATVQLQMSYDADRRPSQLAYVRDPQGAAVVVAGYDLAWDAASNKVERDALLPILVDDQMQYDSIGQLTRVDRLDPQSGPQVLTWAWDAALNRISTSGGSDAGLYGMDATLCEPADRHMNQYTTTPWGARQYDGAGQLAQESVLGGGSRSLTWDDKGQLVSVADNSTGDSVSMSYDVLGRRIAKLVVVGGVPTLTRFVYKAANRSGGVSHLIETRDGLGNVTASFVYGRRLDELVQMRFAGVDYDFQTDDLGSVVAMTDANGQVVARYQYEPFGERTASGPLASLNPFGAPGCFLDVETGFYLLRSRYLDPQAGRFLSRDTIGTWGDPSSLGNALAYVGNNPYSYTDPLGTSREYGAETCDHSGETIYFKIVGLEKCAVGEETIHEYVCDAYDAGLDAESDMYKLWAYAATTDTGAIKAKDLAEHWFGLGGSLTDSQQEDIWYVFDDVNDKLAGSSKSGYRIDIECDKSSHVKCGSTTNAWTFPGLNIHLCPPFFTNDGDEKRAILYHEFTHTYSWTGDKGYYSNKTNSAGVPLYEKNGDSKGTLTTKQLINNADTYEQYLLDTDRYSGESYITHND